MSLHLYPTVKVVGQDFSKEKVITVPNQNLTLRDILKRFIRKESLPVEKEGVYHENLGDLEKMQHEDITVRKEKAAEIRRQLRAVVKADESADALAGKGVPVESPSVTPTPPGGVTGGGIVGQAPPAAPVV